MTVTITVAPPVPLLYAALWAVSVAAYARGLCHLAVFAARREGREKLRATLLGWTAIATWLTSATALSAMAWQAGVPLAVASAGGVVLWRRERKNGKRAAAEKEYAR